MSLIPYALTRPFLFGLDAERAHDLTLAALAHLQHSPARSLWEQPRVSDPVTLAGLHLPQRVLWTELAVFATNPWKED